MKDSCTGDMQSVPLAQKKYLWQRGGEVKAWLYIFSPIMLLTFFTHMQNAPGSRYSKNVMCT